MYVFFFFLLLKLQLNNLNQATGQYLSLFLPFSEHLTMFNLISIVMTSLFFEALSPDEVTLWLVAIMKGNKFLQAQQMKEWMYNNPIGGLQPGANPYHLPHFGAISWIQLMKIASWLQIIVGQNCCNLNIMWLYLLAWNVGFLFVLLKVHQWLRQKYIFQHYIILKGNTKCLKFKHFEISFQVWPLVAPWLYL